MGFAINASNITRINSYAKAAEYFNETAKPRSARWDSNQRPLRDTRSTHLRIEEHQRHGLKCYDLVLYQTPMIRFYQPAEDGSAAVHIQNFLSQSSQNFLYAHTWHAGKRLMLDTNQECYMPLSYETSLARELWDEPFTTRIVMHPNGTVDTKRSVHIPYFRRKSSSTMRAKRARFREALTVVFDLVELKYRDAIENAVVDEHKGRPFRSKNLMGDTKFRGDLKQQLKEVGEIADLTMSDIVAFCMAQVGETVNSIVAHRAWQYHRPDDMSYEQAIHAGCYVKDDKPLSEQHEHVRNSLTPSLENVQKVLLDDLYWLSGLKVADERLPYPQFGKHARNCYTSGWWEHKGPLEELLGIETYCKLVGRKGVIY